MSKIKFIFGLLIIAALITAGCTGTRTMVGNDSSPAAGQAAALNDYRKSAMELTDEINFIRNHYPLSPNATVDEYKAWLGGFGEKLALCRQMYNNTSVAAKKYLGYLNNSSQEYANVTAADAGFARDIEELNQTYLNHTQSLNLTIKKMAALEKYMSKLNATMDAYNSLTGFSKSARVDSMDAYGRFLDGFRSRANTYECCVDAAIAAGDEYASYCVPGSDEYNALQDNNNALRDGVKQCWATYDNYRKDYDSKSGAQQAARSTFSDYVDKMGKASAAAKDLETYRNSRQGLEKLDNGWLTGYRQKLDAFELAGNEAIAAGNACEQYLDPSGSEYRSVQDNKKAIQDAMTMYNDNYNTLYNNYRNLHPLGSFLP